MLHPSPSLWFLPRYYRIKREPQFSVQLSNNIPVTGPLPFGLNVAPGTPGSVVTVGNSTTGCGNGAFPFRLKRDPQFEVQLSNNLPVTGPLPFGLNVAPGVPGSVVTVGNSSTGGFLKREPEPQFSVQLLNNLPVTGPLPFGLNVAPGVPGSVVTVGNSSTGGFLKREPEPQFSVQLSNNLPVTGPLPFGINVAPGVPGSVVTVGNSTTGSSGSSFPFKL